MKRALNTIGAIAAVLALLLLLLVYVVDEDVAEHGVYEERAQPLDERRNI